MKKYLAMLCATMLCVCCLGLVACGGGSASSSAAASGSASASAASASASAASASASAASASASAASASASSAAPASFAGNWKLAAMIYQGITMSGDFSALAGQDVDISIAIKDDGTGTMTYQGEAADFTWEKKGDNVITLKPTGEDTQTLDVTMKDGALFMTAPMENMEAEAIFTTDGVYAGATEIDMSKATPIKSADELVGNWTVCGLSMMGMSMYGDAASLSAVAGDTDVTATFTKNGKATIMGDEGTFAVDANGATVTFDGVSLPIVALGDKVAIDLSEALGTNMVMVFSK